MDGIRAAEVLPLLQERLAILPGGRDRRGGPVLLFPSTPRRERAKPEDYKRLLQYLFAIPSDEARDLRFTVIVDMRGTTWDSVKPILKVTLFLIFILIIITFLPIFYIAVMMRLHIFAYMFILNIKH